MYLNRLLACYRLYGKKRSYQCLKDVSQGTHKKLTFWMKLETFFYSCCPCCLGGGRVSKSSYKHLGCLSRFKVKLMTSGTLENFIWKSALGFLCGVLFTYFLFVVFVAELEISLTFATIICCIIGLVFPLGLAFSKKIRCCVLMTVPHLFSIKGRQALTAYALILSLTGPAKNTLRNTRVLSESLACGQELVKTNVKAILDLVKRPFKTIKETVQSIADKVKEIVRDFKLYLDSFNRIIYSLLSVIEYSHEWLNYIVSTCNRKVGTPYERCVSAFNTAIIDCKLAVGAKLDWLCSMLDVAPTVCYTVKFQDPICEMFVLTSSDIVNRVKARLTKSSKEILNMFHVSVDFTECYSMEMEQGRNVREVASGIATEIRQRTDGVLAIFNWLTFAFAFFFFLILYKVLNYRYKFLKSGRFDNKYITDYVVNLDYKRAMAHQQTILPLLQHEQHLYVRPGSLRFLKSEQVDMVSTGVLLAIATLKISLHMVADYSLWWLLNLIRKHGRVQTHANEENVLSVKVVGDGVVADLVGSLVNIFQPGTITVDMDTLTCLPDPFPPDIPRYRHISITWLLAMTEPYGLRLRSVVMNHYHPDVAKKRAAWLYNRILSKRCSNIKYLRRQLRRKFNKSRSGVDQTNFIQPLITLCPPLKLYIKNRSKSWCVVCGSTGREDNALIECSKLLCPGVYCSQCFQLLGNMCTICKQPQDYGDLSDITLEQDSSDEEEHFRGIKRVNPEEKDVSDYVGFEPDTDDSHEKLLKHRQNELCYTYQEEERGPFDVPDLSEFPTSTKQYTNIDYAIPDILSSDNEESITENIFQKEINLENISKKNFKNKNNNSKQFYNIQHFLLSKSGQILSKSKNILKDNSIYNRSKYLLNNLKMYSNVRKHWESVNILGRSKKENIDEEIPLIITGEQSEISSNPKEVIFAVDTSINEINIKSKGMNENNRPEYIKENKVFKHMEKTINRIEPRDENNPYKCTHEIDKAMHQADGSKDTQDIETFIDKHKRSSENYRFRRHEDEQKRSKTRDKVKAFKSKSSKSEEILNESNSDDEIDLITFQDDHQRSLLDKKMFYFQDKSNQGYIDKDESDTTESSGSENSENKKKRLNLLQRQLSRGKGEAKPWSYIKNKNPDKAISTTLLNLRQNRKNFVKQIKDKIDNQQEKR